MKKLFKAHILVLLVIFILSLTSLLWFKGDSLIVGHDNVFGLNPIVFLQGRLSTWVEHGFGQNQDLIMGTIPIHLIDAIPYFLGFPLQATEKIVYVFWFFMIGLACYILARTLNSQSRLFQLLMVILYQFNFFLLQGWWIGERTKFSAYIAMPLVLAVFIKIYRGELKLVHGVILNSLILFVFNAGGLYGIPLYGGMFVVIGIFLLFYVAINFFRKRYDIVKKLILLTVFTVIGYLLVNSYFLLPALNKLNSEYRSGVSQVGGIGGLIEWANLISKNTSYINLMRLQGIPEWYDNPQHPYAKTYFDNKLLVGLSFLWPFLILLAVFLRKDKSGHGFITFFFLVYLASILLASGTHSPLGGLYELLMRYVPGFAVFRSPYYKFAGAIFLASSFLIATLISGFGPKTRKIFFGVLIIFVLAYHFPYFTGDFFSWRKGFSTRLQVPQYVFAFGNWLNNEKKDDGRVLMLPPNNPDFQQSMYSWGYLSFQALPSLVSNSSVIVNNDRLNSEEKKLVTVLYDALKKGDTALFKKLSPLLHIQYIVIKNDTYEDPALLKKQDTDPYRNTLMGSDDFSFVKKLGEWEIYGIKDRKPAKIFLTDRLYVFDADLETFGKFHDFLLAPSDFVLDQDGSLIKMKDSYRDIGINLIIPSCFNCPFKNRPIVQFPERNITPDTPLYRVVLLLESMRVRSTDPKTAIYNALGLTLKRVSEINEMIIRNRALEESFINQYIELLESVNESFNQLPTLADKVDVGQDISEYLRAERNFLKPNLGTYITRGQQAIMVGNIFSVIAKTEKLIKPYVTIYEETNNRLYQFTVADSGEFELLLRKEELISLIENRTSLTIKIDDKLSREVTIQSNSAKTNWLSFGTVNLEKGFHTMRFSLPESPAVLHLLKPVSTEFNTDKTNNCFGTNIKDFQSDRRYRATIDYLNNFSDSLLMFVWEERSNDRKQLIDVAPIKVGSFVDRIEEIIKPSDGVRGVHVAFCSPNLTQEFIDAKFSIKIREIIEPIFLFKPEKSKIAETENVDFRQISSTKYEISYTNNSKRPFVLAFAERFDNDWELSKYGDTHFRVNGYGNGWIIDGESEKLILEYRPQRYFYYGSLLSATFVVFAVGSIIFLAKRKR